MAARQELLALAEREGWSIYTHTSHLLVLTRPRGVFGDDFVKVVLDSAGRFRSARAYSRLDMDGRVLVDRSAVRSHLIQYGGRL